MRRVVIAILCILSSWMLVWSSVAQESQTAEVPSEFPAAEDLPGDWDSVEEITVVGDSSVGIEDEETTSVVSFSQEALVEAGISNISDLSELTPNLSIQTAFAAVNPTLFIRGVGLDDFNANSASAVAIYQDGIYMNSPAGQLFGLYDVAGVEVLRGPQPTLTNANAGAILVQSRMPGDSLEGYLTSTFGNYGALDFQGALNVPIIPGWISARTAFMVRNRKGITRNDCYDRIHSATTAAELRPCQKALPPYNLDPISPYVNNVDNWSGRALISAKLPLPKGQIVDWLFNFHGGQNKSLSSQFQHRAPLGCRLVGVDETVGNAGTRECEFGNGGKDRSGYGDNDGDPYVGQYDFQGPENLDLLGGSVRGFWQPNDSLTVESLTGYEWHDRYTLSNDDAGPNRWLVNQYTDTAFQINEEFRLTWLFGDANDLVLGGSFLLEDLDADNAYRDDSRWPATASRGFTQVYSQDTRSFGVYGTGHIELGSLPGSWGDYAERIDLDVALRYNWAYKKFSIRSARFIEGGTSLEALTGSESEVFTGWSGKAALTYHISDSQNVYLKYTRGWKPGHFNGGSINSTEIIEPVRPENINSVEAGIKGTWFEERFSGELIGFWYQYQDLQVFQLEQDSRGFAIPTLTNSRLAKIAGLEIDLWTMPIDGLEISLNGAWLDSEYTDYQISYREVVGGPPPIWGEVEVDYSGNRLLASPVFSATGRISYTIPTPFIAGSITPAFWFSWRDSVFFGPNEGAGALGNLPEGTIGQEPFALLNANLSYETDDGRFLVTFWVRNFLDQSYRVQSFDFTRAQFNMIVDAYGLPRTFGATITMNFF